MKKGETTRNAPCGTSQVDVAKPPGIGSGKNQILGSMGLCPQRASSSGLLASGGERAQAFQAVLMSTSEWPCGWALAGRKPRVAGPEALTGPATDAINRPAASAIASLRMTDPSVSRVGFASGSARSRRPGCGPRVQASRVHADSLTKRKWRGPDDGPRTPDARPIPAGSGAERSRRGRGPADSPEG